MINWELATAGRVYPELDTAVVGDFPFIPGATLYVSWDLGLDGTAILAWQQNPDNGKYRLIDSYFNQDRPVPFYFPLFGKPMESMFTYTDEDLAAITDFKEYPAAIHFGDPDVEKRSFQDSSAISTRSIMAKAGIYIQSIPSVTWIFRRDTTKIFLQKGIEVRKTKRNENTMEYLRADRYKMREVGAEFTTAPQRVHGIESHYGTSMEYFFININSFNMAHQEAPGWASKFSSMGDKVSGWLTNRSKLAGARR